MKSVLHPTNNRVLDLPDAFPCIATATTDLIYAGAPAVASFWRPTVEELAMLNAGAMVALIVPGSTMMPAAIEVME